MLTTKEKSRVVEEWNRTDRKWGSGERCFQELLEARVERSPEAIAAVCGEESWTYRELNDRANRLAHYLRGMGVGPEVGVGVCVERGLAMMVGILGILKAGGAYVPMDPEYPTERLSFMLQDSGVSVLLVQRRVLGRLPKATVPMVDLEEDWEQIAKREQKNPVPVAGSENAAYIIYTSGSTGRPKGVVICHGGLANLALALSEAYAIVSQDKVLQFASNSYDAAVSEWSTALLSGASLVLPKAGTGAALEDLQRLGEQGEISVVTLPPSVLATVPEDKLAGVKTLIVAGEACSSELVRHWSRGRRMLNAYGPTETTVCATISSALQEDGDCPIGRPLANTQVYVLEESLQPAPAGVVGELYIGGAGLARGYRNRPDLTAERFIPHPFSRDTGKRLYRSGDLARWRADGTLEYVGRRDEQVKIRGHRIELGEIETALRSIPGIRDAAVVAREDTSGSKHLIAYIVSHPKELCPGISGVRTTLYSTIPLHMVPSTIVFIEALPLNLSGKLDRAALPAPNVMQAQADVPLAMPRTLEEELLTSVWEEVLKVQPIGIDSDFFDLGGDSLKAARILSIASKIFHRQVPLSALFRSPTIAGLASAISAGASGVETPPIVRISRDLELPVTFSQERICFIQQLEPSNVAYHAQAALRVHGALDIDSLKKALNEIVSRHEIFRTTFPIVNGRPRQVIHEPYEVDIPIIDLSQLALRVIEEELQRATLTQCRKPFDLCELPLIRWTLFRVRPDDHILLQVEHHLVHDGASFSVFLTEFFALYKAFSERRLSRLPVQSIQFADFANWQRHWIQGTLLESQLEYWKKNLAGVTPLQLPYDHVPTALRTYDGDCIRTQLPVQLSRAIRRVCHDHRCTLFMALLAAFQALLYRYTFQSSICVGSGIANRRLKEAEHLIGMIINNVAIRTEFDKDLSFAELMERVRDVTLMAYDNQDAPFDMVVNALHPERSLSHNPIFQVMFSFHDSPIPRFSIPGLSLGLEEAISNGSAKFDLNIVVIPHSEERALLNSRVEKDGITILWEYSTGLFDKSTVTRMISHYEKLLQEVVADPGSHINYLKILPEAEQALLQQWNQTAQDSRCDRLIHELFEDQVERTPESIAASCGRNQITYHELNERANRVAHLLSAGGVSPDTVVGVLLDRNLEFIVCILAVLKAGGAFMLLDPQQPIARSAHMIEQSGAMHVVTTGEHASALSRCRKGNLAVPGAVVRIDEDEAFPDVRTNLSNTNHPLNLAYLIYTSGSSGPPKGVMIQHLGLLNHLHAKLQALSITPPDIIAQTASQSFDISIWQCLAALLVGARICILPHDVAADPLRLFRAVAENNISILEIVPSLLRVFLRTIEDPAVPTPDLGKLRYLLVTGESLPPDLVHRWRRHFHTIPLLNAYGPTECSDDVSHYEIRDPTQIGEVHTPIGRPIFNTQLHVLDRWMRSVPIGIPGELYVGGICVGRGYLNDPSRTARAFVPDPFANGRRLYRTGDWVKLLPDGTIVFLRRIDDQVKIRGVRIEPGEIEAVLRKIPGVEECVVTVREDRAEEKRLVAYVVGPERLEGKELRRSLQQSLPEYMIPSAFVQLEQLPLNANGKLDRRELPAPEEKGRETQYVAPRNAIEELVAGIWGQVLGVEQVGVEENFFELGGHSLLATQVMAQVRQLFGIELELRRLFKSPTVAGLAEDIEAAQRSGIMAEQPPLRRVSREGDLPLSFAQQRLWFLDQLEPGSGMYNIPMAMRLEGRLDVEAFARTLQEVVRRHEVLRTCFDLAEGGTPIQRIRTECEVTIAVEDLQELGERAREEEVHRRVAEEAIRPFNLKEAPMIRARLLCLAPEKHVLLLTMHHIASDGWSTGVLMREVRALYEAFSERASSPLPELAIQYADYAVWQRKWLQGEVIEKQLAYWRNQLANLPTLNLPTDFPRPSQRTRKGSSIPICINKKLVRRLRRLSQQEGLTMFMLLLASLQLTLARYSGSEDACVGTPVANRTQPKLEQLVGLFINTLALRIDLRGDPSVRSLLERVREVCLEAYKHQDVPFEQLVEHLNPQRDLTRDPLFQVMLALDNAPRGDIAIGNNLTTIMRNQIAVARFDLELALRENGDDVSGYLVYSTDLFTEATAGRLVDHWQSTLAQMIANPDLRMSEIEILGEDERDQVLHQWNNTARHYPDDQCLHQLVESQVKRTPDAIAITFEGHRLTYRELDLRANQLAHFLKAFGVGPEVPVAVFVERGTAMVVCLLGILKAGGVYVPLDPAYPSERVHFMLDDSHARVVVTQRSLRERIIHSPANVVELDTDYQEIAAQPTARPINDVLAENLAYLMYTSGSTGQPKGTMIRHSSASALCQWAQEVYTADELSCVLASTSICFDLSVFEMFVPLATGGELYLVQNLLAIADLHDAPITLINTVPSLIRKLIRTVQLPPSVLAVNLAGEALPKRTVDELYQVTAKRVVNLYGPSETTTYSTWITLGATGKEAITIGRPVANTQVFVLDDVMGPVPIGMVGEIYIGGSGVARGYFNQPALTANRFVPNPFSEKGGDRLYRTGDRARWRGDGSLEYLGRTDEQVKVRGCRVELREVESALARHPFVDACAAVVREDNDGDTYLVAHVAPKPGAIHLDSHQLQSYMSGILPAHMIPQSFILQESLPLSPNGKIDRHALPHIRPAPGGSPRRYVAPRTYTERKLAALWSEVLGIPEVGIDDNFFDLGGHSLLAIQLISRVRRAFGVDFSVRSLFDRPAVKRMAEEVESLPITANDSLVMSPKPTWQINGTYPECPPLCASQERIWIAERVHPEIALYNLPVAANVEGNICIEALEWSVSELVRRHEMLRTRFWQDDDGVTRQEILSDCQTSLRVVDLQSSGARETIQDEIVREINIPFDLARLPLFRLTILQTHHDKQVVLIVLHHLICDERSVAVLASELHELYSGRIAGEAKPLAPATQYREYALWHHTNNGEDSQKPHLHYWINQLRDLQPLHLPLDRPRPSFPTYTSGTIRFELNRDIINAITLVMHREHVTAFMFFLTTYQILLGLYAHQDDLTVGSPISNRKQIMFENVVGFLVNTVVLRANLRGNPTFRTALRRTREAVLAADAHSDVPIENIANDIAPNGDICCDPLFRVWFVLFEAAPKRPPLIPGLNIRRYPIDATPALFDLTLSVRLSSDNISGSMVYSTDCFHDTTVEMLVNDYSTLVTTFANEMDTSISGIPLMCTSPRIPAASSTDNADAYKH